MTTPAPHYYVKKSAHPENPLILPRVFLWKSYEISDLICECHGEDGESNADTIAGFLNRHSKKMNRIPRKKRSAGLSLSPQQVAEAQGEPEVIPEGPVQMEMSLEAPVTNE